MKLSLFVVFSIFIQLTSYGLESDSLLQDKFNNGLKALTAKKYIQAESEFVELLMMDNRNASAYYNLGIAHYKLKEYGKAIWAFEKTLQLEPKNSDALQNIDLCYDKLSLPVYTPIYSSFSRSLFAKGSNFWAILGLTLISISVLLPTVILSKKMLHKKALIISITLFCFIIGAISYVISYEAIAYSKDHSYGIIIEKPASVYIANDLTTEENIAIGTRVKLISSDDDNNLVFVQLPNNHSVKIQKDAFRSL